jgi:tRNA 2-thiouridine synthesizing protein C
MIRKKILFLQRQKVGLESKESLDAALVASAFDQEVCVLFSGDGVQQLEPTTIPSEAELQELVSTMSVDGIDAVYVCKISLEKRGLNPLNLLIPATTLTLEEQSDLIATQDAVIID